MKKGMLSSYKRSLIFGSFCLLYSVNTTFSDLFLHAIRKFHRASLTNAQLPLTQYSTLDNENCSRDIFSEQTSANKLQAYTKLFRR